ncbi:MAG TPA: hypothetical protein PKN57_04855 [Saprospiraceae bacterium]|nr:hypothetical protein [Saprospiraceae bacterium]MCC6688392.1 hypothetical protein [Saprospiraceae bacterium]HMV23943.1 hypothetical protein [Saprospiraceae bacterium]HMW74657.1 hypothetical protein [Saprospiraceae bacterium]HMX82395.1 hypothetical protein [Saprospiraceae bacterium]
MKTLHYFQIATLAFLLVFSACSKDNGTNDPGTPSTGDPVTLQGVNYEASGTVKYVDTNTGKTETMTYTKVTAQYKDQSHIWPGTFYTFLTFTNLTPNQTISFVFPGKELPKSGIHKIGPWPIATNGITEADKLKDGEMAIFFNGRLAGSKRADFKSINVLNDNGKILLDFGNEVDVFDNITGDKAGNIILINVTKTTKKL